MTSSALHVVNPPKFAGLRSWDCARCEHQDLRRPIFLSDGHSYGARCAAIALGLVAEGASEAEATRAFKAHERALVDAETEIRHAAMDARMEAWEAFCAPYGGISEAIAHFGGYLAARDAHKAAVAA